MHCYKLILAYDGTLYGGWQIQPNTKSIQEKLKQALFIIYPKWDLHPIGSGRTDAGVHAKGQTAHFKVPNKIDPERLLLSLNGLLPADIRVRSIEEADPNFHARYSATGKEYHYYLHLGKVMNPFLRLYCWQVKKEINIDLLRQAASRFVGLHDFTSFANESHKGAAAKNPIRHLYRLDVCVTDEGIRLEFEGNGFLYKMVRNITGTLIDVGSGKLSLDELEAIFEAKDRRRASQSAPAQGLFLIRVDYTKNSLSI